MALAKGLLPLVNIAVKRFNFCKTIDESTKVQGA